MVADDLNSVWNSDPLRIAQSIKPVGKELDREKEKEDQNPGLPKREEDSVELSTGQDEDPVPQSITINVPHPEDDDSTPGSHIDVIVGK